MSLIASNSEIMDVINQHCDAVPASAKGASWVDNSRIVTGCEVIDLYVDSGPKEKRSSTEPLVTS